MEFLTASRRICERRRDLALHANGWTKARDITKKNEMRKKKLYVKKRPEEFFSFLGWQKVIIRELRIPRAAEKKKLKNIDKFFFFSR